MDARTARALSIEEKPSQAQVQSRRHRPLLLRQFDVLDIAASLKPSHAWRAMRSPTSIVSTSIAKSYSVQMMGRGFAWLDTGTHDSLAEAGQFVEILERRQGLKMCCLEEIAFNQGFIDKDALLASAKRYGKSGYGKYLERVAASA